MRPVFFVKCGRRLPPAVQALYIEVPRYFVDVNGTGSKSGSGGLAYPLSLMPQPAIARSIVPAITEARASALPVRPTRHAPAIG